MVIASIDLMSGKAVQLKQGREKVLERENPIELAKEFDKYGEIALIDLDAAMGRQGNLEVIKEILKISECRVGGGTRNLERAKEMVSWGAKKVIVGSKAFEDNRINHRFLKDLAAMISRHSVIIAVDCWEGEILTEGWRHRTGIHLLDVIKEIEGYCSEFLYTAVAKEGLLKGSDKETVQKLRKLTTNKITVAGGVSSMDEIRYFASLGVDVQLGMALYTGWVSLDEAFIESLNWRNSLIPTVIQDSSGRVLTLAYSSRESLRKTFEMGKMWYFSRSRNKLWMKGETSGNSQELLRIRADCDQDALLVTVNQKGVACHSGAYSCFGEERFTLFDLYEVIKERMRNPKTESYTARLTEDILKEKIREEAEEVLEAESKDEVIWEVADIIYFLTVFLAKKGLKIEDVLFELGRRRKK